jgi:hypothetical protein
MRKYLMQQARIWVLFHNLDESQGPDHMSDIKTYSFNEEAGFLELKTEGVMKVKDIISHYVHITMDDSLQGKMKVLIDSRGTRMDLRVEDIALTKEAVEKAMRKFSFLREAIIVDKPYETVIATMFERFYSKMDNYQLRVFSTENAARNWLMMNF